MVPTDLLFWVAPLDRWVDQQAGVMCRRHADSIVVPVGWTYDDRRDNTPRLFRSTDATEPTVRPKRPRAPRPAPIEPVALPLDHPAETPDDVPAPAWRPEFDDDNLDGLLEVRSPLLARAFRGVDRPKS
jgi:hypothetical protein